jgi:D-beta-D-heptose 7-phosphate kinase/D-beta-D-heptose 1-phosphate adenosyltransferase
MKKDKANKKILVIGESCVDVFIYCSSNRMCPDVPAPVLKEVEETRNSGMAMNLYYNLVSLGMPQEDCKIWTQQRWDEVTKTRYVHKDSNHTFIRIDKNEEDICEIRMDYLIPHLKYQDIIAISDYNKGFLSENDIAAICERHKNVFIDTKKKLGNYLSKAKYIKINTPEYSNSEDFINKNKKIRSKIIKTAGKDGAFFRDEHFPSESIEVRDVSGAGDTFFAGLIYEYSKSSNINDAIVFANKCAAKVVQKRGVSNDVI